MNIPRKMIETGARALAYEQGWNWDKFDERSRDGFRYTAQETIRAAIGCAEVVRTNNTTTDESVDVQTWCEESVGDVCPLHPGDTILIVRGEP